MKEFELGYYEETHDSEQGGEVTSSQYATRLIAEVENGTFFIYSETGLKGFSNGEEYIDWEKDEYPAEFHTTDLNQKEFEALAQYLKEGE